MAEIAEKRRNQRVRKVCPVSLSMPGDADNGGRRMVTANVSPGGMLLVTRMDRFPPAGCAVSVRPEAEEAQSLPARVVYTRYSPRAEMRFAGVKFEGAVTDNDMRWFDLDQPDQELGVALQRLAELEATPQPAAPPVKSPQTRPTPAKRLKPVGTTKSFTSTEAPAPRRDPIIREMAEFCSTWGEAKIKDVIVARHALSRAKGVEGMRLLKRSWLAANADMPSVLEENFTIDPSKFSMNDRMPPTNPIYDEERDQAGPVTLDALRSTLGAVGRVLVEHGYEDLSNSREWATDPAAPTKIRYTGPLPLSDPLRDALRIAAADYEDVRERDARSQRETRQRHVEELMGWWDQS